MGCKACLAIIRNSLQTPARQALHSQSRRIPTHNLVCRLKAFKPLQRTATMRKADLKELKIRLSLGKGDFKELKIGLSLGKGDV